MSNPKTISSPHFLVAAVAINALLGVLYGWSLIIVMLEGFLQTSRAMLSLVPAVGLIGFTVGVFVHDALLRRIRLPYLAASTIAMAGAGHLLFWLSPTYISLLIGYGIVFGTVAGVGYGLAIALARGAFIPSRGSSVGLTVAAFAASGMAISALGAIFGLPDHLPAIFGTIGIIFVLCAVGIGVYLRGCVLSFSVSRNIGQTDDTIRRGPFLLLAFGFFALCYLGLTVVSHGSAILVSLGVPTSVALLTPFIFNSGYIAGALLGGVIANHIPRHETPLGVLTVTMLATLSLSWPLSAPVWLSSMFLIGVGFGSTVSLFIMLFSQLYGADRAGGLFARLNIGYGLAGFAAPLVTGWLYDQSGDYVLPIYFGGFLGACGICAISASNFQTMEG